MAIFGSLAAGILLTLANVFLLVPLIPVWLVLRRLPGALRWVLYPAAAGVLLALAFLPGGLLSPYVLVMPSLGRTDAWAAVLGGAFASFWLGRYALASRESGFRATAMAALYFVAVMGALVLIQGEITRV